MLQLGALKSKATVLNYRPSAHFVMKVRELNGKRTYTKRNGCVDHAQDHGRLNFELEGFSASSSDAEATGIIVYLSGHAVLLKPPAYAFLGFTATRLRRYRFGSVRFGCSVLGLSMALTSNDRWSASCLVRMPTPQMCPFLHIIIHMLHGATVNYNTQS